MGYGCFHTCLIRWPKHNIAVCMENICYMQYFVNRVTSRALQLRVASTVFPINRIWATHPNRLAIIHHNRKKSFYNFFQNFTVRSTAQVKYRLKAAPQRCNQKQQWVSYDYPQQGYTTWVSTQPKGNNRVPSIFLWYLLLFFASHFYSCPTKGNLHILHCKCEILDLGIGNKIVKIIIAK